MRRHPYPRRARFPPASLTQSPAPAGQGQAWRPPPSVRRVGGAFKIVLERVGIGEGRRASQGRGLEMETEDGPPGGQGRVWRGVGVPFPARRPHPFSHPAQPQPRSAPCWAHRVPGAPARVLRAPAPQSSEISHGIHRSPPTSIRLFGKSQGPGQRAQ